MFVVLFCFNRHIKPQTKIESSLAHLESLCYHESKMLWIKVPSDAHTQATRAGTHCYFRLKQIRSKMCTINLGQIALETFLPLPPSGLVPTLPLFLPCLLGVGGSTLSLAS